ncbi:MAG: hypothetical protein FJ293_10940, partial [Planctomycetes bacterium]|nr:hypothetical protein [Planctomycetota bacterium]
MRAAESASGAVMSTTTHDARWPGSLIAADYTPAAMSRSTLLLGLLLALSVLVRAWVKPVYVGAPDPALTDSALGIDWPFGDDLKGASDALHTLLPRNLLREGLAATGGWPNLNPTDVAPADYFWYDHHPPGITLFTAAALHLFGTHERVTRGVALLFATLALLAVAAAARRAGGAWVAALAIVVMSAPPGGLYWASQLDYPVPTMAACGLFLVLATRDEVGVAGSFVMGVAVTAALCFDFLAALALVALFLDRLLCGPRGRRRLFGWPLVGITLVALILLWKHLALSRHGHGDDLGVLGNVLQIWQLPADVTTELYLATVRDHLRSLLTPLGEVVLLLGLLRALLPGGDPALKRFVRVTALLALGAGLLPRARAWDHPYFQLYWLLPLGGSAALLGTLLLPVAGSAATGLRRAGRGAGA